MTDAIYKLLKTGEVDAVCMQGKSHDFDEKLGYIKAFVEYGLRHEIFSMVLNNLSGHWRCNYHST
ncbi:TPA: hypothetical protein ACSP3H_002885 [Aeromonas veronii]